ncbi:inactive tyrosine-protein kinase 7-like isoform X2 [Paramacrobiotus metropolitanus]|uniref:inactive tyrosine-protein kinase 7-like isoform X2 n=1 Tax=Paramacrobiotus metropolitanus TaxID=2943436 RepID=UPI002445FAC8|nr:inactive tyrosine-protein kinase 7-like isoform X2 [Paramacrobiotus metropolitanus]
MLSQVCWLILFWSATRLCVDASDTFYFTAEPEARISVIEGQRLILPCDVSEHEHIDFHWTFNNYLIENSTRRYQNGSQLIIDPVYRLRDTGQYQCTARNASSGFSRSSRLAELDIEWLDYSVAVRAVEGVAGGLDLRCQAQGINLGYRWYRNNVEIAVDGQRVTMEEERLVIRSLSVADNGVYSCTVKNGFGEVDSSEDYVVTLKGNDIANIKVLPKDVTVRLGAPAQFDCVFEDAVKVEWYHRSDDVLKNSTGRRTLYPNGTLFLPKVKPEDEGYYRCAGYRNDKDTRTRQVYTTRLKVAHLPVLSRGNLFPRPTVNNRYIAKSGSTLEVYCNASMKEAFPRPTVEWTSGKGVQVAAGPFWLIEGVQTSHAGNYTCSARTPFAVENYTVFLIVTVPPVISREPSDVTVNEDASFQLICSYKGSPPPLTAVTWHRFPAGSRQSIPITMGDRWSVTFRDTSSVLSVSRAVADIDAGQYRCQVKTNGFEPVLSEPAVVKVRERLKFLNTPMNQHLILNEHEKVVCAVKSRDPVTIQWSLHDGKPFPQHVKPLPNGTLSFEGVQYSDQGSYRCSASTRTESLNATIRIDVVTRPVFTVKPAERIAVVSGTTLVLHCNGTGDPLPVVHWSRTNEFNQTVEGRWEVLENGSLLIGAARMNDSGTYACTIGSKGGFDRAETVVMVHMEAPSTVTQTISITIACAVCYVLVVLVMVVVCKRKRARKAEASSQPMAPFSPTHTASYPGTGPESQALLMQNTSVHNPFALTHPQSATSQRRLEKAGIISGGSDDCRYSPITSSAYSSAVNSSNSSGMYFSRNQLINKKLLGRGHFGEVLVAGTRDCPYSFVMVKTVQTRDEELRKRFNTEMDMLFRVDHMNVAKYVGLCRATSSHPDWVLFEHYEYGDLCGFVRTHNKRLTMWLLLDFAHQIAQGMQCISEARYIHRDLATRNCIVQVSPGGQPIIKVSVMSITRDGAYDRDYVQQHNQLIPLRWMPAEAVFEDEFSVKSDVWSFGVVCFELLTLCRVQPYAEYSDIEVSKCLETGTLELDLKEVGGEQSRKLIRQCLEKNPKDRPTFGMIVSLWACYYKSDDSSSEYQEIGPRFA